MERPVCGFVFGLGAMAEELLVNELEAKTRSLDEFRARLEGLREENQSLLEQLHAKERDSMVVNKRLTEENESLKEKLEAFEKEAEEAKLEAQQTARLAQEERDLAIAEMEAKVKKNEEGREEEMYQLREELAALKAFKDRKEVVEAELERLQQELADARTAHKEAMTGVERKLIEEKTRLQKEAHAQLQEIKRNTDEEVVNRLDISTKRILQQNRRLAEDLKLHVQETADLQKQKAKLEAETKTLRRDLELNAGLMEESAKDRHRKSRESKELQSKVKNLEKSLAQVVKDFERERERLVAQGRTDLEETEIENQGLRKLLKLKEREHSKIKRLAQDIIGQRSEVEQFFLEALEQVRDEAAAERARTQQGSAGANSHGGHDDGGTFITAESSVHFQNNDALRARLPTIGGGGAGVGAMGRRAAVEGRHQLDQRVDIRDLSWEDKERVLRLLFAKINQAQTQATPKSSAGGAGFGPLDVDTSTDPPYLSDARGAGSLGGARRGSARGGASGGSGGGMGMGLHGISSMARPGVQ